MLRASSLGLQSPQITIQVIARRWSAYGATQLDRSRYLNHTWRRRQSALPDPPQIELPVSSQGTAQNNDAEVPSEETKRVQKPVVFSFPEVTSPGRILGRALVSNGFTPPPAAQLVGRVKNNPNARNTSEDKRARAQKAPSHSLSATFPAGMPWKLPDLNKSRISQRQPRSTRSGKGESVGPLYRGVEGFRTQRRKLLRILASTSSASDGWQAYSILLTHPLPEDHAVNGDNIPLVYLHRLARLLARERRKTRTIFIHLLSVLTSIHNSNGIIHRHEWNSLIDCAGRGWRQPRLGDYRLAYSIYRDMTEGRPPGTSSANDVPSSSFATSVDQQSRRAPVEPDIYTYSTLISIAADTLDNSSVRHALSLLHASGLQPNRLTHISLLQYFSRTNQMAAVRSTLSKMQKQNLELGLDGVNACIWAYGQRGHLRVVRMIYRLLRRNIYPDTEDPREIESVERELRDDECFAIHQEYRPNQATFTLMVQLMAYHGDFVATLTVFADMMGAENWEQGAPITRNTKGQRQLTSYTPTLAIFRAVFLGFSKHAIPPSSDSPPSTSTRPSGSENQPTWSLQSLQSLFTLFCKSITERPSRSVVHWIMVAFDKASGHDIAVLRQVWKDLERTYDGPFAGPTNRLSKWQQMLFPEEEGDEKR
ncbi:hypothetical protein BDN72DRAFT_257979 [Pluteus cervinus]|uniref:Uncharacterized protein n=1 Tax=Pluteus cervinus TaxID=181527 RepID=A0ACD3B7T8_9AGAR|nr:hypothetical protein BDN72DRAFT_257979 [Pluteus cervinus]